MAAEHPNQQLVDQLIRNNYCSNKRSIIPKSFAELATDLHQDLIENNIFDIDRNECVRKLVTFHHALIVPNNSNNSI